MNFSAKLFNFIHVGFILMVAFGASHVHADEIALTASADKTAISLEDSINLSITIKGAKDSPPPTLPDLKNFNILSTGTQTQVQVINSRVSKSIVFTYNLVPKNAGRFEIGAAKLELDGKIYSTQPIPITVSPPTAKPRSDRLAFAEASISKTKLFVNEQAVYTFKLFRRVNARNINLQQTFDGFREESLGQGKEYSQVVDGIQYNVYELSKALFPSKAGVLEIPPSIVNLDFLIQGKSRSHSDPFFDRFFKDPFFGGARSAHKILRSPAVKVEILPLPEKDKPADFSNLVGQFAISARLGKHELEFGDSTTLTLTVSGKGNVYDIPAPNLDVLDQFKVYPDRPDFKKWVDGKNLAGGKTFKWALVPLQEGDLQIPPITLSYFDPGEGLYVARHTKNISIKIAPAPSKETLEIVQAPNSSIAPQTPEVQILGEDILPIHTRLSHFSNQALTDAWRNYLWAVFLTPVFLFCGTAWWVRHKDRLKYDRAYSRHKNAYKSAKRRLQQSQSLDSDESIVEISKTLREYVGDKLNLHGAAFTPVEVEDKLREKSFQEEHAKSIRALLEKCEAIQYRGGDQRTPDSEGLIQESFEALERLEQFNKKS